MEYFELKKYSFFPDMKKMADIGGDNWEYIALAFEIAIPKEKILNKPDKFSNFFIVGYLYIDYCEGSVNVNFDIPNYESNGELFFCNNTVSKLTQTKKVKVEDNRYDVKLKLNNLPIEYKGNLGEIIEQFISKDVIPDILNITKFLDSNNISYEKKLLKYFISKFCSFAVEQFSAQSLSHSLGENYKKLDNQLVYHKLSEETEEKPKKTSLKI